MKARSLAALGIGALLATVSSATAQTTAITIRAASAFDGRGRSLPDATVVVQGGKIVTVQSGGSPLDVDMRAAIARGLLPGPRLLTSIRPVNETTGSPAEIRAFVRKVKADGADLVKLFASKSSREGGTQTMTDEQVAAACGEAKSLRLRTWVHAHSPS